jgi:hypothetical protein
VVAGQRDLQATAQRSAVDGGRDRQTEGLQPAQLALDQGHVREDGVLGLRRGLDQAAEVATGEEGLLRAGQDDAAEGVLLGLEPVEGLPHRPDVVLVHGVGRRRRVVEGEDDDAVGVGLPADGAAHARGTSQTRSTTVAMPIPPPTHRVARP